MINQEKKHAYLIMAHNNFYTLEKLLLLLDDERNDIFIHMDQKVRDFDFPHFETLCKKAEVHFAAKRINISWGTQSLVKAEMCLFETAYRHGEYSYYHLLSGADLPLKSQKEIHDFFDKIHLCYLRFHTDLSEIEYNRLAWYHVAINGKNKRLVAIREYLYLLQRKLKTDRCKRQKKHGIIFAKGWEWGSLTGEAVRVLVENKRRILRMTRLTCCSDEMYKQTILLSNNIPMNGKNGRGECLHFIDWQDDGNHPKTLTVEEYDRLLASEKFFARKFDERIDRNIIDMIYNYVNENQ